ncbi:DinB family protein [Salibacterium aidingense]|uniref:DinB family protein n=1 Tax=Salibacterium aidingense TaxID=384933 RepID=UPI003BC68E01
MKDGKAYASLIKEKLEFFPEHAASMEEEQIRWKPSEEEWSIMELLCHVEEFPLYFTNELVNVVDGKNETWGRNVKHEGRLQAVDAADQRNVDDVLKGMEETKKTTVSCLERISAEDLRIEKPHNISKFGTKSMEFLVEHFLVEHLDTHQNQFNRIVSQYEDR